MHEPDLTGEFSKYLDIPPRKSSHQQTKKKTYVKHNYFVVAAVTVQSGDAQFIIITHKP